jgi:hypothetical protein
MSWRIEIMTNGSEGQNKLKKDPVFAGSRFLWVKGNLHRHAPVEAGIRLIDAQSHLV